MYESYFGLSQRPFAAAPLVERFFPASSIDAARQALSRCIERAEGVGVCVGAAGMGKSLLLEVLADQFSESFSAVLLSAGAWASRRELLQSICFELKIPYQGMDEGELRLALVNQLTRTEKHRRGIVLLVDEAHTLSVPLLEELRMLSNLVHAGEPRVRLAIAGNLRLEEQLASPQLESFSQRLACRTYLEPFDRAETTDFVRFQIAVAGGRVEHVFEPSAVDAVYRATDGVPRLVNQLCDHALLMAYSQEQRPVAVRWVEKAWADLQQLPVPWQEPPAAQLAGETAAPSIIEFGALSDDFDEPAAAEHDHQEQTEGGIGHDAECDREGDGGQPFDSSSAIQRDCSHAGQYPSEGECRSDASESVDDVNHADDANGEAADNPASPHRGIVSFGGLDECEQRMDGEEDAWAASQTESSDEAADSPAEQWAMNAEHSDPVRLAEARFEELASQFEALQAEDTADIDRAFTEAELAFDDEDPFETFEEEEPLVDPYAAVDMARVDSASTVPQDVAGDSWSERDIEEGVSPEQVESPHLQGDMPHDEFESDIEPGPPVEAENADETEDSWEDAEEWNVHDAYHDAGPSARPVITSQLRMTREADHHAAPLEGGEAEDLPADPEAADICDNRPYVAEAATDDEDETRYVDDEPDYGMADGTGAAKFDRPGEPIAEVVIDPYAGLTELGERLRQEALRLTGSPEESMEPPGHDSAWEPAASDEVASTFEPVAGRIEDDEASQSESEPVQGAEDDEDALAADDPIELHQEKLTLAEAIRRRKVAGAAQPAPEQAPESNEQAMDDEAARSGVSRREAAWEPAPAVPGDNSPPQDKTATDHNVAAGMDGATGDGDEQVVIVLDDDTAEAPPPADEEPRVQREDYQTLFERLRRG